MKASLLPSYTYAQQPYQQNSNKTAQQTRPQTNQAVQFGTLPDAFTGLAVGSVILTLLGVPGRLLDEKRFNQKHWETLRIFLDRETNNFTTKNETFMRQGIKAALDNLPPTKQGTMWLCNRLLTGMQHPSVIIADESKDGLQRLIQERTKHLTPQFKTKLDQLLTLCSSYPQSLIAKGIRQDYEPRFLKRLFGDTRDDQRDQLIQELLIITVAEGKKLSLEI